VYESNKQGTLHITKRRIVSAKDWKRFVRNNNLPPEQQNDSTLIQCPDKAIECIEEAVKNKSVLLHEHLRLMKMVHV
jgi:hypothetical protein